MCRVFARLPHARLARDDREREMLASEQLWSNRAESTALTQEFVISAFKPCGRTAAKGSQKSGFCSRRRAENGPAHKAPTLMVGGTHEKYGGARPAETLVKSAKCQN